MQCLYIKNLRKGDLSRKIRTAFSFGKAGCLRHRACYAGVSFHETARAVSISFGKADSLYLPVKEMKKKLLALILAVTVLGTVFAACGKKETVPADMKIAVMTGPTAMGMTMVMDKAEKKEAANNYTFEVYGTGDEIATKLIKGELDAACVPCNLASVLFNKSKGEIVVCAINTLGVLYIVDTGTSVNSVADLKGRTIYATGQGTTPEYTLRYMLSKNGIDPDNDVTIEFLSEAAEVTAAISDKADAVAMLPQPYVTVAKTQNSSIRVALDVTEEWEKADDSSTVVTGVLVARKSFIDANRDAFDNLLDEYKESVEYVNANNDEASELIEHFGIFKAAVSKKALPDCNVTFIEGSDMKEKIKGYLNVLYAQNPASVGGELPGDEFYYER